MATMTYDVPRIHCDGCVRTITMAVNQLPGISKVDASFETKKVLVEFNPGAVDDGRIREALKMAGYPAA